MFHAYSTSNNEPFYCIIKSTTVFKSMILYVSTEQKEMLTKRVVMFLKLNQCVK